MARFRRGGILVAAAVSVLSSAAWAAEERSLRLTCPPRFLEGIPAPVFVEILDGEEADRWVWEGTVALSVEGPGAGIEPAEITIHNGQGSALVAIAGAGDVTLRASFIDPAAGELRASAVLESAAAVPRREVGGALPAGVTTWGPEEIIAVDDDMTVPAGATLRLEPGAIVLLGAKRAISVLGAIECLGTREQPILLTAAETTLPWGEIRHEDGANPSTYRFAFLARGGDSPAAGHTGRGPVVRAGRCEILFEDAAITDNYGKGLYASGADLRFLRAHFARSAMGMEVAGSPVEMDLCSFHDMFPGGDVADNDAVYFHEEPEDGSITVRDTVFAFGGDDGIDTLSSHPLIQDSIVRDFEDKGVSIYHGTTRIEGTLIASCATGVSAKGDRTEAWIERTTIADCSQGLEIRDKYNEPENVIWLRVRKTIVWNVDVAVRTDYDPKYIEIVESDLEGDAPYPGDGNLAEDPRFVDPGAGDYHLAPDTPCPDMGAFPRASEPLFRRGYANADATLDLGDAVTILLYLFASGDVACRDAADTNDDGALDLGDPIGLLSYLFASGPPPAAPFAECGADPSEDDLDCLSSPACPER
ncbi:MAG: right-handed parallel beta-helix repeat-containing protein [Planctomycetes bacterium]|nr:right-handed parallel beta-helix repeat-containing protein [Planctomycetota bacterium]